MKYKRHRGSFVLVMAFVVVVALAFVGCQPFTSAKDGVVDSLKSWVGSAGRSSSVSVADASIRSFSDTTKGVTFRVSVVPREGVVELGTTYVVVLLSRDGYFFDGVPVSWSQRDFEQPLSGERNVGVISELEGRKIRTVTLSAPAMDKDIVPLRQEYFGLRREKEDKANRDFAAGKGPVWWGPSSDDEGKYDVTESDYQRIASKYVRVEVVTMEEFERMVTE